MLLVNHIEWDINTSFHILTEISCCIVVTVIVVLIIYMSIFTDVITALVLLRYYTKFDGFVVVHGTDTMSYSASALSFMLENLGKTVILTGSQVRKNCLLRCFYCI